MAEYDSFKVLQVPCPKCGIEAGEECVTDRGKKATYFHTARKAVVYPSWGANVSGRQNKSTDHGAKRRKLCKAIVDVAMKWYNHAKSDADLVEAIKALKDHRAHHPEVQG